MPDTKPQIQSRGVVTGNTIKLIACLSMLIDHIGFTLLANNVWCRCFGRIAFALYIFLLIEGYRHTKDVRRYALRLALFGVLSEAPFDLGLYHRLPYWERCNVMWTLLLGLFCITMLDSLWTKQRTPGYNPHGFFLEPVVLVGCFLAAELVHCDYHAIGVLAIVTGFSLARMGAHRCVTYAGICAALLLNGWKELFALVGLLPIFLYRGEHGTKNRALQYAFYAFYPVHLLVLYCIWKILH